MGKNSSVVSKNPHPSQIASKWQPSSLGLVHQPLASMQDRAARQAQQQDQAFRTYVQEAAGPTNSADQLAKLADLKASGAISDQEFQTAKAKLLA